VRMRDDDERAARTTTLSESERRVEVTQKFVKVITVTARSRGLPMSTIVERDALESARLKMADGSRKPSTMVAVTVHEEERGSGGASRNGPDLVIELKSVARGEESA